MIRDLRDPPGARRRAEADLSVGDRDGREDGQEACRRARPGPGVGTLSPDDIASRSLRRVSPCELDKFGALRQAVPEDQALAFEMIDELASLEPEFAQAEHRLVAVSDGRLDGQIAVVTGALGKLGPIWVRALADPAPA